MKGIKCGVLCILAFCALCACAKADPGHTAEPPLLGGETEKPAATYRVLVTDEDGKPISGVPVQLCSDICVFGTTDGEGKVLFEVPAGDYYASVMAMPEGYISASGTDRFDFAAGSGELTIVLKKTSGD